MRLGGAFPFNSAGAFPISLGGGGYFYPPAGNYWITLGTQSVLQWQDPVLTWRNYIAPPGMPFYVALDGYNWRIINMSGVVQAASITNAGSGGTNGIGPTQTGTVVSFAAAPTNGQTAKGYAVVGGSLPALSIANAGSGFQVPPLILIDPPPSGGVQATATATITSAGVLNAVTLNNAGAGYLSLPNVYVVPQFLDYPGSPAMPYGTPPTNAVPPGTFQLAPPQTFMQGLTPTFPATGGALVNFGAATGVSGSGTLTAIVMTEFGSLYTSTGGVPAISFAGGGLAGGVAATAVMAWAFTAISNFSGATIAQNGAPVESSLGQLVQYSNNNLLLGRPMRGSSTTGGVVTIMDPGFAIQTAMASGTTGLTGIVSVMPTGGGAGTMGPVTDTSILQMMVND